MTSNTRDVVAQLPYLGLGLSSNLDARALPRPYALLEQRPGLFDYLEYSAPVDLDEARRDASLFETLEQNLARVPALLHPVHLNLYGPALEPEEALKALDAHAHAVRSPWVGNDVAWWHTGGRAFPGYFYVSPPMTEAGLRNAEAHARWVQSHLRTPLALENPTLLAPAGPLHVLTFMAELHARTGLPLVLDLGHLYSHQLARALPLTAGLDDFSWDAVIELHIAGGVVTRRLGHAVYFDDHTQPVPEALFTLLEAVLPRCRNLRAVTFEGDGHPDRMARTVLERLRPLVKPPEESAEQGVAGQRTWEEERPAAGAPGASADSALSAEAWAHFATVHRTPGKEEEEEDPAFLLEREVRLSVLLETLDARFPMSRVLVCPDTETLGAFWASPEYRAAFETGAQPLDRAFMSWMMRTPLFRSEPSLAAVLAFETLAEKTATAAGPNGATVSFPVDFSELAFAAKGLRRHLGARALATGRFDQSGFEHLRDIARRAPRRLWQVHVKSSGGRIELQDVHQNDADAVGAADYGSKSARL